MAMQIHAAAAVVVAVLQELSPLGSRLLSGIALTSRWHVLALLQPVVLAPGQQLCWEGQPAQHIWLMQVGDPADGCGFLGIAAASMLAKLHIEFFGVPVVTNKCYLCRIKSCSCNRVKVICVYAFLVVAAHPALYPAGGFSGGA
jgi:hypothetical protein